MHQRLRDSPSCSSLERVSWMTWSVLLLFFVVFVVVALTVNLFSGSHLSFSWRLLICLLIFLWKKSPFFFECIIRNKKVRRLKEDNTQSGVQEESTGRHRKWTKRRTCEKKKASRRKNGWKGMKRKKKKGKEPSLVSWNSSQSLVLLLLFCVSLLVLFSFALSWILLYLKHHRSSTKFKRKEINYLGSIYSLLTTDVSWMTGDKRSKCRTFGCRVTKILHFFIQK